MENKNHEDHKNGRLIYWGLAFIIVTGLLILSGYDPKANALPINQSMPGERNTGDQFTFTMNNVSGQENVTHHFTIYSSKLYDANQSYIYFSVYFGQWLNQTPEKGKKWLFVWVEDWIDGTPTWPYDASRFNIWIWGNTTVKAESVQLQDLSVRQDRHLSPAIIQGVTYGYPVQWREHNYYGDPYGWRDGFTLPRIEPGKSNSWSGWIKYQVPENADLKDIRVAGWFLNWGTCYWNLVPRSFVQVAAIPTPVPTVVQIPIVQRDVNRVSDQPSAPEIDGRIRA